MRLGDVAKITLDGHSIEDEDLDSMACLVHAAALRRAQDDGHRTQWNGTVGWTLPCTMAEIILSLWPENRLPNGRLDGDWAKPLYVHLKGTGSVVHIRQEGAPWWIRESYSSGVPVMRHVGTRTRAEARLTPAEAGEDREPGDVTVTKTKKTMKPGRRMLDGDPKDAILSVLLEYDRPLTVPDFDKIRRANPSSRNYPSGMTVKKYLQELQELGLVQVRKNPEVSRPALLIAHADYQGDKWDFIYNAPTPTKPVVHDEPASEDPPVTLPEEPVVAQPVTTSQDVNSADDDIASRLQRLIDARVAEATRELQEELRQARAQLAEINRVIGAFGE